jgi:hypothetical protein
MKRKGMKKQLSGLLIIAREVEVQHNDFFCEFTKFEFQQLLFTLRRVWVDDT